MSKIVLIDGNNLLYRSYYATAYSGNMMKNSKGFPTNALFGFVNMLNKIIEEEKPEYMMVALDKGKTFRHNQFENYKAGRQETPDDLKIQFGVAKTIMDNMGVKYFEVDGYEADDIIGTFARIVDEEGKDNALIVSSDKDLLQLISNRVIVKLLKTKDYILMDKDTFIKEYGLLPNKIIDLKALHGDPSDNIPGVRGIGEKTALKLLEEHKSIENIYVEIDKITGKVREKLIEDKDKAFMSKELATIYKEVPINAGIKDITFEKKYTNELIKTFEELEFYSFIKNLRKESNNMELSFVNVNKPEDIIDGEYAIYLEVDNTNYHKGNTLGVALYNKKNSYFISTDILKQYPDILVNKIKYAYDLKKTIVALKYIGINLIDVEFDTMLAAYILNYNVKDDIAYLANALGYEIPFYEAISKAKTLDMDTIAKNTVLKSKFVFETADRFTEELKKEEQLDLFNKQEMPLIYVLSDMEYEGIYVDKKVLDDMNEEINIKLEMISNDIYNYAGTSFNISSPKQLGDILFNTMKIPYPVKVKGDYSTSKEILYKLKDKHPIINKISEYRALSKIQGTYIIGLSDYILKDGKIHTIFNQMLTKTGRLSSVEPNLQNIPIRYDYGRLVRKAFVPSKNHVLLSSDYSQIELRVFAHMSGEENLIDAFREGMDIHTKTAMDIFKVSKAEVNSEMRRQAKAVNFGILYGISSFGLSENLDINVDEAREFIKTYLDTFPGIKNFMDSVIKEAHAKGYVKTLMGHKRVIDELNNKNYMIRSQGERMALNTPIQGSSADIIKKAMIDIYAKFNELKLKSKMIIQVHDELIFDVLKDELEIVKKTVEDIMENCVKLDVPLKVESNYGENWYVAK